MQEDIFHPALSTHKLSGKLKGLYAASCGYDCRIIFAIERHGTAEEILLITFGSHDAVY
jgi:mRNA-degrading endonuclease YafQ of YafQ-DinJ toxin-antitoxin module